mmetsp:Transcript_64793/g.200628  ORF Transcript_64793/g.200628 Transcript_64793/m.200628 type:complete len:246 (+) Transcript_64793:159-896(+)
MGRLKRWKARLQCAAAPLRGHVASAAQAATSGTTEPGASSHALPCQFPAEVEGGAADGVRLQPLHLQLEVPDQALACPTDARQPEFQAAPAAVRQPPVQGSRRHCGAMAPRALGEHRHGAAEGLVGKVREEADLETALSPASQLGRFAGRLRRDAAARGEGRAAVVAAAHEDLQLVTPVDAHRDPRSQLEAPSHHLRTARRQHAPRLRGGEPLGALPETLPEVCQLRGGLGAAGERAHLDVPGLR